MTTNVEWRVTAVFVHKEQAKQAAEMLTALQPREYTFSCLENGRQVWYETGAVHLARERRV